MRRKPGTERGAASSSDISWDEALDDAHRRACATSARPIRSKLAYFTGRDQMQALTGLWAQQFGTINWAAHGGFCSVNMAAAGLYTIGPLVLGVRRSGLGSHQVLHDVGRCRGPRVQPDQDRPGQAQARGGKFVAINPVRTGYQAIADEWIPIKPGTDGMLALSMVHVLLSRKLFDWEYLVRYTNAPWAWWCDARASGRRHDAAR